MKLNDKTIKKAKPQPKQYMSEAGGMYLLVHSNGGKCWQMSYRFSGKYKTLALGILWAQALGQVYNFSWTQNGNKCGAGRDGEGVRFRDTDLKNQENKSYSYPSPSSQKSLYFLEVITG